MFSRHLSLVLLAMLGLLCGFGEGLNAADDDHDQDHEGGAVEKKKVVFIAGRPSHGYGAHEHRAGSLLLAQRLNAAGLPIEATVAEHGWPEDESVLDEADAIVIYCDGGGGHLAIPHFDKLDELMAQGKGLMCIHYAVEIPKENGGDRFKKWLGGYYEHAYSTNPHWLLQSNLNKPHPITNGVRDFAALDEWYYNIRFRDDMDGVVSILKGKPSDEIRQGKTSWPRGPYPHIVANSGREETVMWAAERGDGGRGVGFTGGHFHRNWANDSQRKLVLNSDAWIAGVDEPEEGVWSRTPTQMEMEANQDFPKPEQPKEDKALAEATQGGESKPLFESEVINKGTPGHIVDIEADITGKKRLYLVVKDGGDGFGCDWADWINPRIVGPKGTLSLLDLEWEKASTGWNQVRKNQNADGGDLRVDGTRFTKGIGTHANSVIVYKLPEGYTKFLAQGGLDEGGTRQTCGSTVKFAVYANDEGSDTAEVGLELGGEVADIEHLPEDYFTTQDGLKVELWASSPLFYNPTNIDIDHAGNIWVAEGMNYRGSFKRPEKGDRIVVVKDTDGDGKADDSHTFVQEKFLVSPLGVAVIDNKVIVSQPPVMLVYTDTNRNLVFDEGVDTREELLTGFEGRNHDHSLHAVTVGPDGKWYWNSGNMGATFTDNSGKTFYVGSPYNNQDDAGKVSDDGHVYLGGFAARMDPDGKNVEIIGHNFRNSYEQTVSSFGDVFQNDNDDPPACRTTWLMEYGNMGFASRDGKRSWGADRRPGQSTPVAEWRQEDPGTIPAGDVYGGGAPTGIAFYENGALGEAWQGTLLSCESARNVVYGYSPAITGAGYALDRYKFLTSNVADDFSGTDFRDAGGGSIQTKNLFRPSDVAVGPDGAIYVADWFDARVGGHATRDEDGTGAIYRIAPEGAELTVPKIDRDSLEGQITALKSPAVNVRAIGFYGLRERGESAIPAVSGLLEEDNPFVQARAVWLLSQLGPKGVAKVEKLLGSANPMMRLTAFRALRRQGVDVIENAGRLATDASPALRREAALAMRDISWEKSRGVLVEVAKRFDGADRWYLEALGMGASGKESELYRALVGTQGAPSDWSPAFARIAWRLHTDEAIPHLKRRALTLSLPTAERELARDALAFNTSREAAEAMVEIALVAPELRDMAAWWVNHRNRNLWRQHDVADQLKIEQQGNDIREQLSKIQPGQPLPPVAQLLQLRGDAERGKQLFHGRAICHTCHAVNDKGGHIGPDLTAFGSNFPTNVILEAIANPSATIAFGYEAEVVTTKEGGAVTGFVMTEGDPIVVRDVAGIEHAIDAADIQTRTKLELSLMPAAQALAITPQDAADLAAYMKSIK